MQIPNHTLTTVNIFSITFIAAIQQNAEILKPQKSRQIILQCFVGRFESRDSYE